MKWSSRGACVVLSSALRMASALSEVAVGLRCMALGSAVKTHFRRSAAAGAFYSGLLVGFGQALLGLALLCCSARAHGCRNLALVAVVVLLLGILAAFSGAVLDGDAATLVQRKYSHFCFGAGLENAACARLREYQRSLVLSVVLSSLECILGLFNLLVIKRYKAAHFSRRRRARQSAHVALFAEDRDAELPHVSYINLAVTVLEEPPGTESRRSAHPSLELPGYAPNDHHGLTTAPPTDLPPAYEDIYPQEGVALRQEGVDLMQGGVTLRQEGLAIQQGGVVLRPESVALRQWGVVLRPEGVALRQGMAPRRAGDVSRHRDTL